MNILVTGANGQLGNEMRIISQDGSDRYIFTDVNQVEGLQTTFLDITDLEAVRSIVREHDVDAISRFVRLKSQASVFLILVIIL